MRHIVGINCPKVWHDCLDCVYSLLRNHSIPSQSQACHVVFENVNTLGNFIKILTLSWVCIIRMEISWEYFFPVMPLIFLPYSQAESNTNTNLTGFMYIKMKNNRGKVLISTCPEFNLLYFGTHMLSCSFVTPIPSGLSLMSLPRRQFKG